MDDHHNIDNEEPCILFSQLTDDETDFVSGSPEVDNNPPLTY